MTGHFLWQNIILTLCKILEHTEFSGGLEIYFLGLPLIAGLIIFEKDSRLELLMKNINNFQTGEEVVLQLRYFLYLINTKDKIRESNT